MKSIDPGVCSHPAFEPERYLGTLTSEYVCLHCGRSFGYEHARYILEKGNSSRISSETQILSDDNDREVG